MQKKKAKNIINNGIANPSRGAVKGGYAESMIGLGKEVWDKLGGAEKYLKGERDSWGDR